MNERVFKGILRLIAIALIVAGIAILAGLAWALIGAGILIGLLTLSVTITGARHAPPSNQ